MPAPSPASTISAGDIVELKSGSPPMTVGSIESGKAQCFWFANNESYSQTYPVDALVKTLNRTGTTAP